MCSKGEIAVTLYMLSITSSRLYAYAINVENEQMCFSALILSNQYCLFCNIRDTSLKCHADDLVRHESKGLSYYTSLLNQLLREIF